MSKIIKNGAKSLSHVYKVHMKQTISCVDRDLNPKASHRTCVYIPHVGKIQNAAGPNHFR